MPIPLTVSQVRAAIYRSVRARGADGNPSTPLLGRIFHESAAALLGDDERVSWRPVLSLAEPDEAHWRERLETHLYEQILGPRLTREQARLQGSGGAVLDLWQAARALCRWYAQLQWTAREQNAAQGDGSGALRLVVAPDAPLSRTLRFTGWTDTVELTGMADLVLSIPTRGCWCVVEFKLGQACPEADLAQACLYHLLLAAQPQAGTGAVALVRFRPELEERVFEGAALRPVQQRLLQFIGHMAGILPAAAGAPPKAPVAKDPYRQQAEEIVAVFGEYGRRIALSGAPLAGPTFIRYPVRLARGVRLSAAQRTAREVQHRLGLATPPLLHIADGGVVLDVQRPDRRKVSFDKLRPQLPDPDRRCGGSKVLLGLDLNRKLCFADLAEPEHTHILVAGTTGSGKSEWLRCALAGLLLTNTPETLRLVLIDPKRNTFAAMRGSRFLLPPFDIIYPDERSTADVFSDLGDEMDERYRRMQAAGCDQRDEFVRRADEPMARIVCICDEYLDLINRGRDERRAVERQVFRLGAKARSAGIHLIIATQQPSRQVIKGALDANLPARVGLKMNRDIESQMLLGCRGAENLLGNGDLLFKDIGDPVRLQAPLLSAQEREAIFGRGRLGA